MQKLPSGAESQVIDLASHVGVESTPSGTNGHRKCKFILIEYSGSHILVFGDLGSYRYHANLLRRYCEQRGIETSWEHEPDLLESRDPALRVLGGGMLELDTAGKSATFSGASKAYGSCPWRLLETVIVSDPILSAMTVRIES